jgi:GTPase SAR1 family protein
LGFVIDSLLNNKKKTAVYLQYYGLNDNPFSIAPNPDYLFMSTRHKQALAHLSFGLNESGGFVMLTGEVGTGKTTVSRKLMQELGDDTQVAVILNPTLSALELLATVCDELSINVWELIGLANRHPRVNILNPGPGVGGHCIAVDPWFIVDSCPEQAKLIKQARLTNDFKPEYVIQQISQAADQFKKPVIACLGLSFKANIDDLRESPALQIVQSLADKNIGEIIAVEPNIHSLPEAASNKITLTDLDTALKASNVVVVLVDHNEFKVIEKSKFAQKVVIDTRGII